MRRFALHSLFSKTLHFPRPADALSSSSSYSTAAAAAVALQPHSITDYLVTTCGVSPGRAARISGNIGGSKRTSLPQFDTVVGFLKSQGLDGAQMGTLFSWYPRCLILDVEKCLVPKFQALKALGFSGPDVVDLFKSSPIILSCAVENVVAKIQFWQGILGSNDTMVNLCRSGPWLLGYSITNRIKPNIDVLRECGITDQKLTVIAQRHPMIIGRRPEELKALISRLESLGVNRSSGMFYWALSALCAVSKRKFEAQLELFKGFGLSEDEFLAAFRKAPVFLTISSQNLQKKMEFITKEVGCDPSYIACHPVLLTLSLEKRIIPRCQILRALKSRGLCGGNLKSISFFCYTELRFLERHVFPHKEKIPELIELYKASLR